MIDSVRNCIERFVDVVRSGLERIRDFGDLEFSSDKVRALRDTFGDGEAEDFLKNGKVIGNLRFFRLPHH